MEDCIIRKREKSVSSTIKRFRNKKLVVALIIITTLFVLVIALINTGLYPAMIALSESKIRNLATKAILDSIMDSISGNEKYAQMLECMDNGNKIYMLQADTIAMNCLAADCTRKAQQKLSEFGEQGIKIALGTITGVPLLSGFGPKIKISFTPAGSVKSEFVSSLESCGINQSLYRVNIVLTAQVYIIMPGISNSVSVSANAAIAESVIVGDVPQVYTNVENQEDMLNLIPTEIP